MSKQTDRSNDNPVPNPPKQPTGGGDFVKLGLLFVALIGGAYLLMTLLSAVWPR
jgi:hypothetical protein